MPTGKVGAKRKGTSPVKVLETHVTVRTSADRTDVPTGPKELFVNAPSSAQDQVNFGRSLGLWMQDVADERPRPPRWFSGFDPTPVPQNSTANWEKVLLPTCSIPTRELSGMSAFG